MKQSDSSADCLSYFSLHWDITPDSHNWQDKVYHGSVCRGSSPLWSVGSMAGQHGRGAGGGETPHGVAAANGEGHQGRRAEDKPSQATPQWPTSSNLASPFNTTQSYKLINGLIPWWASRPHDPITSQKPHLNPWGFSGTYRHKL